MRITTAKIHLGIWFILAVIVPSLILSFLAIRTVAREEAFLEKRLQDSLLTEVNYTASLIKTELDKIQQELGASLNRVATEQDLAAKAVEWRRSSPLVSIPFFLSNANDILWPLPDAALTADEKFFLQWGSDFLRNQEKTPVYENIARVYKDKILEDSQKYLPNANTAPAKGKKSLKETWGVSSNSRAQAQLDDEVGSQYSPYYVQQYEPVRKGAYKEARAQGQMVSQRQVIPQKSEYISSAPREQAQDSIFIADELKLSQIIRKSDSGIIPFIVKEKLRLLFWKKENNGAVSGCLIDPDSITARIIRLLPGIYSDARILTVLDENAKPIITPQQDPRRDWSRPFVAAEISEILPRWEVAAYLTHPGAISAKAQTTEVLIWILIFILLVSIIAGGTLVLRSVESEMRIAQQKTTFAANVSHELKTPLTSIRMFAEMLKDNRQPDEKKRHQYFEIMVSETERLTRLINNVLDFSRMGKAKKSYLFKSLDIVSLCQSVLENQRARLEYRGFTVRFGSSAAEIWVKADEEAIKQILINLLSNAEKYSGQNKEILLEIHVQDPWALVNVLDRGMGIAAPEAAKIFEEFYRVDDSLTAKTQGTGLGLTIARRIARDHSGDVRYFPREGGGSLFQIQLPLDRSDP